MYQIITSDSTSSKELRKSEGVFFKKWFYQKNHCREKNLKRESMWPHAQSIKFQQDWQYEDELLARIVILTDSILILDNKTSSLS